MKKYLIVIGFLLMFVCPVYSQVNGKIVSPTFSSVSQLVSSSFESSTSSIVLTNRSSYKLEIVNIFPDGINAITTELNNNFQPGESIKIPASKSSSNGIRCFRSIAYKASDFNNENIKGCELMKLQAKMGKEVCQAVNGTLSCFSDAESVLEQNNWCDNSSSEQSFQKNQQNNSQQTKSNNNTENKNKSTNETGYQINQSIQDIGNKLLAEREKKQNQQEENELRKANESFNEQLSSGKYIAETCTECDGSGYNSCEKCNGSGGEKCYACSGRGTETCGMCSGTGTWLNQTCITCGGKGTKECYTCSGEGFKKCWYCNGKGKTKCFHCNGVGKITRYQESKIKYVNPDISNDYSYSPKPKYSDGIINKVAKTEFNSVNVTSDLTSGVKEVLMSGNEVKSLYLRSNNLYCLIFGKNGYKTKGLKTNMLTELERCNKENLRIDYATLYGSNGWLVINQDYGYSYDSIPKGAADELKRCNINKLKISIVAFTKNEGWVVINGGNGYNYSNIPNDLASKIIECNEKNLVIKQIAFTPTGGWAIIFGSNGYLCNNIPVEALKMIESYNKNGKEISVIAFSNNGYFLY